MQKESKLYLGDCLEIMPQFETDSIDAIVTDPPYGISFMGKDWDKAVPSIAIWKECLRVLKPGAFAFVMSIPRQDCLARMICRLEDAGFNVAFSSIYHAFSQGFPKAQNLSKAVDKRANVEQKTIGVCTHPDGIKRNYTEHTKMAGTVFVGKVDKYNEAGRPITIPTTEEAKALDGAYSGFQPKPAVEVVIVAMKSIEEKTYIDQALKNGHGATWLDECRIPTREKDQKQGNYQELSQVPKRNILKKYPKTLGRFPANVLCEDDVLNDGNTRKSGNGITNSIRNDYYSNTFSINRSYSAPSNGGDIGSFSRYFSLDAWFAERIKLLPKEAQKTFPWLIVPKASKSEKNRGLDDMEDKKGNNNLISSKEVMRGHPEKGKPVWSENKEPSKVKNNHPTTKPLKLMMWLIILGTQEGDIVLDPFMGSGTTPLAAKMTNRYYIGIEREKEFFSISVKRTEEAQKNMDSFL